MRISVRIIAKQFRPEHDFVSNRALQTENILLKCVIWRASVWESKKFKKGPLSIVNYCFLILSYETWMWPWKRWRQSSRRGSRIRTSPGTFLLMVKDDHGEDEVDNGDVEVDNGDVDKAFSTFLRGQSPFFPWTINQCFPDFKTWQKLREKATMK